MEIQELRNRHAGEPAFCLGTAPHLSGLNLALLRDQVTIASNQLLKYAAQYDFKYVCIRSEERLVPLLDELPKLGKSTLVMPSSLLRKHPIVIERTTSLVPVNSHFTSPGHAEFFSFNLGDCVYAADVVAMGIQLAVWMGCNPIYVLGVDAKYQDAEHAFFDSTLKPSASDVERDNRYGFADLREWLAAVRTLLWARGIRLFDASGEASSLDVLPKIRLNAAARKPRIAVTSKTFCRDRYLVEELSRYFADVKLNDSSDKLEGATLVDFLKDSDAVVLGTEPLGTKEMSKLPCLRFVSKYGVGVDNIDFDAAKRHHIQIAYRKGTNSDSVAELTLAFALMLSRRIDESIHSYRDGKWAKLEGRELAEMTVGIIGYGHVGKIVAQKFVALGVRRVLVNDLIEFPFSPPVEFVPLDYLLNESDIVSLHISMEEKNRHFAGDAFLRKMRADSLLINTARGEVLDEQALASALREGRLAGAALDVYEAEPRINAELVDCPRLLTTCHIAGSSNRAIKSMGWAAIEGLLGLLDMEPA